MRLSRFCYLVVSVSSKRHMLAMPPHADWNIPCSHDLPWQMRSGENVCLILWACRPNHGEHKIYRHHE